jgi:chromosomal replication initiation ATPase DnaA
MEAHDHKTINSVNRIVARRFGVNVSDILNHNHTPAATDARRACFHICYFYLEWSLHRIRAAYQRKSVSSVHDLIKSATDLKTTDPEFAEKLNQCWDQAIEMCPDYNVVLS